MSYIYHLTALSNFKKMIWDGRILCKRKLQIFGRSYTNIAYEYLQDKRKCVKVPIHPGGTLDNYVPFHFAPRSPMMYAIHSNPISNIKSTDLLYLVVKLPTAIQSTNYIYCDRHPLNPLANFSNNPDDLNMVNWNIMKSPVWFDTDEEPNRKSYRQAEFLIHNWVDIELVRYVGVHSKEQVDLVESLIQDALEQKYINTGYDLPQVILREKWFFI